jgi:hypothetical protein
MSYIRDAKLGRIMRGILVGAMTSAADNYVGSTRTLRNRKISINPFVIIWPQVPQ